ncbi:MAG: hypothetical protein K6E50_12585 [Lachnospiraceae bacterium]|nr:hypothetical protein [Lachnospiraceae bacterium]
MNPYFFTGIGGGILLLLILTAAPLLCGGFLASDEAGCGVPRRLVERYLYGLLLTWGLFELCALPFVLLKSSFRLLCIVYGILLLLFCVAGLAHALLSRKKKDKAKEPADPADLRSLLPWIPVFLLLAAQIVFFVFFRHLDGDDSYYIAQSVISLQLDSMFQRDAYTGYTIFLDGRHALATLPLWISFLSAVSGIHPAIIAHSILAPFFLTLLYACYGLLGDRLLQKKRNYLPLFLILLGLWYSRSHVSLFTAETFAYTRTWQGKAVFSNLIIPLAFCFLWDLYHEKKGSLKRLLLLSICAVFSTTAAVFLLGICYGCAALSLAVARAVSEKKLRPALKAMLPLIAAALPLAVFGFLYLLIRR